MFPYQVETETRRCIERIEVLRKDLDRMAPLPRIWMGRTRRDLEVEAVAASTRIEGVPVTVDEARRILAGDRPATVDAENVALVEGYRDAMRYVLAHTDDPHFGWHTELLLAIHHRVMAGAASAAAGRLRDRQNWISSNRSGEQVYLSPGAEAVPGLVAELMAWLEGFDGPAAVAAALAHVRLAAIHPFVDGNGRVARILASVVMFRAGYQAPQFTSLEEWWGRHVAEYYEAFGCLGTEWDERADVSGFVRAHVCAQATQVDALALRQETERAVWTVLSDIAVHDLGLDQRVTHALYDAFHARQVTNRYYRGLAEVSEVTASHDLGKLAASGMLERRGAGRASHYVGTGRLADMVAEGAGLDRLITQATDTMANHRDRVLIGLGRKLHGKG